MHKCQCADICTHITNTLLNEINPDPTITTYFHNAYSAYLEYRNLLGSVLALPSEKTWTTLNVPFKNTTR